MRPSALFWALAAGAVVMFYMRRIRPPRVVVSRPYLWQEVLGEPRPSATAWGRRRVVSAATHLGIVVLLALAAADPCLRRPKTVVFVVDNSRSMEAVDGGSSRLARARELLARHLEAIGARQYAAIVTTAGEPVVVASAEQDLQRVADRIQRLHAVDLPSRVAEAVELARGQAAGGTEPEIHVFSDGCFAEVGQNDLASDVVIHPLGSRVGNAAVTRVAVRRYPYDARRFQLIAEVTNRSEAALVAPLQVLLCDNPIHEVECRADAGSKATIIADLESESAGPIEAVLQRDDALREDNRLATTLPNGPNSGELATARWPETRMASQDACETLSPQSWCVEPPGPRLSGVVPLWRWLVLAAVAVLAVEWGLYHRRWTE